MGDMLDAHSRFHTQIVAFREIIQPDATCHFEALTHPPRVLHIPGRVRRADARPCGRIVIEPVFEGEGEQSRPKTRFKVMLRVRSPIQVRFYRYIINVVVAGDGRATDFEFRLIEIPGSGEGHISEQIVAEQMGPCGARRTIAVKEFESEVIREREFHIVFTAIERQAEFVVFIRIHSHFSVDIVEVETVGHVVDLLLQRIEQGFESRSPEREHVRAFRVGPFNHGSRREHSHTEHSATLVPIAIFVVDVDD